MAPFRALEKVPGRIFGQPGTIVGRLWAQFWHSRSHSVREFAY
jgi:hypothetical protein